MKKILLTFIIICTMALSGCAILLGVSPVTNINFGGMHIFVRASTANLYLVTNTPEEFEADLPFHSVTKVKYKQPIYDSTYGFSGISLYTDDLEMDFKLAPYDKMSTESPDKFPNDGSDSTKSVALFDNFFVDDFTKISAEIVYDTEKNVTYKCFTRNTEFGPQDVCGAARFSKKGNVAFFAMQSKDIGMDKIKEKILETINSAVFKTEQ